jgi:titin
VSILIPIPTAPTGLSIVQTFVQRIDLEWNDNSNNERAFAIERSRDGVHFTRIATVGANARTYAATSLTPDTEYFFRVRAWNTTGYSRYSNVVRARTSVL